MSHARYLVGDVFDRMAQLPDDSVDLVLTSPPFLALRSYLPADHPDKAKEIGSEPTPAAFLDTLLALTAEWRRLLAPHGSICVELGDTYSGSGGAGGDYNTDGLRDGQPKFTQSRRHMTTSGDRYADHPPVLMAGGTGWPLAKSLACIPQLYEASLAYGRNLLTGQPSPAGQWRVRNMVAWCLDGDTVVYARTPKGEGPTRLLHLTQNWQPGQWDLWDGARWTPVLGWSSTEASDAIEIEFRNGERISATRGHEWPTQRGLVRTDALTVGDVVPSVRLPGPDRQEPAHLPAEDIGWLVGTFLADGSFDSRDRIQIAGHRDESTLRVDRLRRIARAYDGTATDHNIGDGNEATVVVRSPLLAAAVRRYVGGTSARNKCLRAAAWRRSDGFLSAALDGYLDGDGHWDAKNERWRLGFTDNGWLARDLRVICARLGYRCKLKRHPRAADPRDQFAGTARFSWRGEIRSTLHRDLAPSGQVVTLKSSKRRRFFDVGIEGEPHLFALGSGLLTHNCRPNPPVGALGDKFRPATSYLTIACVSDRRYFDLDAVREPVQHPNQRATRNGKTATDNPEVSGRGLKDYDATMSAGAPPLDWWNIPTHPYPGAHYSTWPPALCVKPILAMAPQRVCTVCGEPSRRITEPDPAYTTARGGSGDFSRHERGAADLNEGNAARGNTSGFTAQHLTTGWTSCGHDTWRNGLVLDPFAGSGTTLAVASGHGRDAIGIDLDPRNADLARDRVGMFLEVEEGARPPTAKGGKVAGVEPVDVKDGLL